MPLAMDAKLGEAERETPLLQPFLSFLERDIALGNLQPAGALFQRMSALVGDERVDLDAPLDEIQAGST